MANKPERKVPGRKLPLVHFKEDPADIVMHDVAAYQEANAYFESRNPGHPANPGYTSPSYTSDPDSNRDFSDTDYTRDTSNAGQSRDSNLGYSTVGNYTRNRESVYTIPTPVHSVDGRVPRKETKQHTGQNKKCVCAMVVFVVLVILVNAGLLVYLFLQVYSLKNELAASQLEQFESTSMQQLLNSSISEQLNLIENRLGDQDIRIQSLNTSIGELPLPTGIHSVYPAASCAALPLSLPSGYYWVRASNGSAVLVYCDMTRSCDGVTGGWRRVAYLDMTNSSHQCPNGFMERIDSNQRTCVRISDPPGCSSIPIHSAAVEYSRFCGRIIGYQVGTPEPFLVIDSTSGIDTHYVNGVSLTYGDPRKHIWTFGAGGFDVFSCPCRNPAVSALPPAPFIGNDYFCESGTNVTYQVGVFYGANPLWDGAGCESPSTCCSFNDPPWFHKQLPQPTTDDIEVRVCRDQGRVNEDVAIEIIEIYVQ